VIITSRDVRAMVLFSGECVCLKKPSTYFSELTRLSYKLSRTHAYVMHLLKVCLYVCPHDEAQRLFSVYHVFRGIPAT